MILYEHSRPLLKYNKNRLKNSSANTCATLLTTKTHKMVRPYSFNVTIAPPTLPTPPYTMKYSRSTFYANEGNLGSNPAFWLVESPSKLRNIDWLDGLHYWCIWQIPWWHLHDISNSNRRPKTASSIYKVWHRCPAIFGRLQGWMPFWLHTWATTQLLPKFQTCSSLECTRENGIKAGKTQPVHG